MKGIALKFTPWLVILSVQFGFSQSIFEPNVICTDKEEYGISFINEDWICFTRREEKKTLFFSKRINGKWGAPTIAPFSGENDDEYPKFNPSSNRLFFASNRPYEGKETGDVSNDIWYVELKDGVWSEPVHLSGKFSTSGIDSGGMDANDEVFFHSDRSGKGLNAVDIYRLTISGSSDPVKLPINTTVVDGEPYLFNGGESMLFMSGGHNSAGASDIFLSVKKNGEWQLPVSVDTKGIVNTAQWEYTPSLNPDHTKLFFTRIHEGQTDIYFIEVSKLVEVSAMIKGNAEN